jgi:hypothetical protein
VAEAGRQDVAGAGVAESVGGGGDGLGVGETGMLSDGVGVGEAGTLAGGEDTGSVTGPPLAGACDLVGPPFPGLPGTEAEGDAEADAPRDVSPAEGPALAPAEPDGPPGPVSEGAPESVGRSGVEACRAGGGSSVGTPGWRIGAIGGCLGSGFGVTPDIQA